MRRLLVVAASGLAREVLAVERTLHRFTRIRVLDDDPALWGTTLDGKPIVGGLEEVTTYADHALMVCAGSGAARRTIVQRLDHLGVARERYVGLVHPRVTVPPGCRVGVGTILLEGVVMTADVQVGDFVVAMPHVTLTHDDAVGDYATLCAGASLGGGVRIGEAAYLGMNCSVRERRTVGAYATLGMGGALVADLPAGETWAGVPARPVRRLTAHYGAGESA